MFAVLCCVSIGHIFLLSAAVEEQQWAVRAQPEGSALPSCPGCQAKPGTDSISHLQRRVMRDSMFLPAKLLPAIGGATSPGPQQTAELAAWSDPGTQHPPDAPGLWINNQGQAHQ